MAVSDWADMVSSTSTIQVAGMASQGSYGQRTWTTAASTYVARWVDRPIEIRVASGDTVMARGTLWVLSTADIPITARVTLPDGTTPPLLTVERWPDETGEHHSKIMVGY